MVRVKICGITSVEDATAAVRLGADALGFVFAPSPRRVTPDQARRIIDSLPPLVLTVGVFVNAPGEELMELKWYCGLDALQLSGNESEKTVDGLHGRVFKGLKVGKNGPPDGNSYPTAVLLLDTESGRAAGGTGKTFDWRLAVDVAKKRPIILAGGLTPENVRQAIETVHPYGVDVSSGVEMEPGRKDHDKIARFIHSAKFGR